MIANKRNIVIFVVGFGLLSTFCCCSGNPIPGEDVVALLATGWVIFLTNVLPQMSVRWEMVANAAAYVAMFVVGCHYFFCWLYRETRSAPQPGDTPAHVWRWTRTIGLFTLIVLMFATGLATTGALQQTGWMLASNKGIYESHYARSFQKRCQDNLKEIAKALNIYAADHQGRLPKSLAILKNCVEYDRSQYQAIHLSVGCEAISRESHYPRTDVEEKAIQTSYLYFGAQMGQTTDPHAVVITEPLENHHRLGVGINVLYKDGTVEWLEDSDAENLLKSLNLDLGNHPESQPTTQP